MSQEPSIKCCLCNEEIEMGKVADHTLNHLLDEMKKKNILLELNEN